METRVRRCDSREQVSLVERGGLLPVLLHVETASMRKWAELALPWSTRRVLGHQTWLGNAHLVQRSVTLFAGPVGSPNELEADSNIDRRADSSIDDTDKKIHTPFLGWRADFETCYLDD